ncbi:WD repeat-containing protein, putative [Hepatocystis sp. ex Piliocolobus tephrosceles]|nr:WD repeat-containing protein, putative [Hepatocystis sp. ex Piliocolobus tephrosceles]
MNQNKILLVYDNYDILLVNLDNEIYENKFKTEIKDNEKKIHILKDGNFFILNSGKKIISQYILTKNDAIYKKYVSVYLNVIRLTENEKLIIGGDKIGNIYIWSGITGFLINSFQAHMGLIKDILIDEIVNIIYTYGDDNVIHVYNLNSLLKKNNTITPMLYYQHDININIKQMISINSNMYDTYYNLITLTTNGNLYFWGLKYSNPVAILNTNSEHCTYICTNNPFNTHLYLCKSNKIFRIPLVELWENQQSNGRNSNKSSNNNTDSETDTLFDICTDMNSSDNNNKKKKKFIKNNEYSDYMRIIKEESRSESTKKIEDLTSSILIANNKGNNSYNKKEFYLNLKKCTVFIGHKNEIIKCYVHDKNKIIISLAKDGIKIWDLYNCYAIKTLKYGENIIDFYIPIIKQSSYINEIPNLLLEYENNIQINIINEKKQTNCQTDNNPFLINDQNILTNMANMFTFYSL